VALLAVDRWFENEMRTAVDLDTQDAEDMPLGWAVTK
jgi:hypothetical protein